MIKRAGIGTWRRFQAPGDIEAIMRPFDRYVAKRHLAHRTRPARTRYPERT
jgi:hypothetical protein